MTRGRRHRVRTNFASTGAERGRLQTGSKVAVYGFPSGDQTSWDGAVPHIKQVWIVAIAGQLPIGTAPRQRSSRPGIS